MKYIRMYPIVRNKACVLRYLYGSLNLYSAQMEEEEYIINKPNRDNSITLININLSIFFIVSTLLNYMFKVIKKHINLMCYSHTPYTKANRHRMNPTIQNNFTIFPSLQPNLSK